MKTRKLWIGLGAALSLELPSPIMAATPDGTPPSTSRAETTQMSQHMHATPAVSTAPSGGGGEGGEGSAAQADADARLDPAIRFYRDIQLVRGHLLVGDELIAVGAWADALPHFLHPVEELYGQLAPMLKPLDQGPFLTQLKVVVQTVKAKNKPAYDEALARLRSKLDAIDVAVKTRHTDWTPFAIETALETMRSAVGEYGQSIQDGHFAKAVEYQDSRGFVFQAEALLQSVSAAMTATSASAVTKAMGDVATLKTAWPSAIPPKATVLDAAQVLGLVSKIELALSSFR